MAVIFNYPFPWRRYPSILSRPLGKSVSPPPVDEADHERIMKALRSINSFVDVSEEDLRQLVTTLQQNGDGTFSPPEKSGRGKKISLPLPAGHGKDDPITALCGRS